MKSCQELGVLFISINIINKLFDNDDQVRQLGWFSLLLMTMRFVLCNDHLLIRVLLNQEETYHIDWSDVHWCSEQFMN